MQMKGQQPQSEREKAREYRRGRLAAIADVQHILNVAIHQARALGQRTPQLEEVRAAVAAMLLGD